MTISVRNGRYLIDWLPAVGTLEARKAYIVSGELEATEACLYFTRTEKTIQLQLDNATYAALNREAKKEQVSLRVLVQRTLSEKAEVLKTTEK
ncbi:hypothetical protein PB01_17075 [Psychrobacillus glaciei]|uniref:Uncharacterized protein n=1 Tax=Psychrobacillus glaciei TaxID=2283160 RepID=A0A5J6SQS8_9BACI|nr:hypothetical protein PB01_17075 [Psychrobacillus glaciei]